MKLSQLPALGLAFILGLFLLACSGSDSSSPSSSSSTTGSASATASPTSEPTEAAFPVTIEHKFGQTTIAAEPKRVIALGYMEQDPLLALGVKPIATRYWFSDEPYAVLEWAKDELGDAKPEVLNMPFGDLDFEKIAALQPDLISAVYAGITEEEYTLLSQIAPTIAQTSDYIDFGMPWQEGTVTIGRAVGREALATQIVDDLKAKFEAVKAAHPDWQGKSVAVVAPRPDGQVAIFGSGDLRSRVFTDLGFEVPAEFDEITGESFYADVSAERADLFDQDLVIVHQLSYYEGGEEALRANAVWSALDAVKEERAVYIPFDLDTAYGFNSVLSMEFFLDGILPQVEAAMGATAQSDGAFPVTIEHKLGSTTITESPQRVVSVGHQEHDTILALGVKPIAVRDWWNDQPFATWVWAREALGDAEPVVLSSAELDLEVVAGLDPDLIIGTYGGITEDEYEVLSQLAPTLAQPAEYADFTMPWREQTLLIGKALGKEPQAQKLIDDVDAVYEAVRKDHPEFEGATFVIGGPNTDGTYWMYGEGDPRSRLMEDIGFVMPADLVAAGGDEFYATLSAEKANLMDTDVFIALVETEGDVGLLERDPVFQHLDVVKEGRVIYIPWDSDLAGALSFTSVLSLPYAIEQLTPMLADALAGR